MTFKVMFNFLTERERTKPPRTKPSRQKTPWQNPRTKTPASNWDRICTRGLLSGFLY